jgi:hypothetical protein
LVASKGRHGQAFAGHASKAAGSVLEQVSSNADNEFVKGLGGLLERWSRAAKKKHHTQTNSCVESVDGNR